MSVRTVFLFRGLAATLWDVTGGDSVSGAVVVAVVAVVFTVVVVAVVAVVVVASSGGSSIRSLVLSATVLLVLTIFLPLQSTVQQRQSALTTRQSLHTSSTHPFPSPQ
jgi:hypothetical protein